MIDPMTWLAEIPSLVSQSWLTIGLTSAAVLAVALYVDHVVRFGYWKRRGIPGPKPSPITGNVADRFRYIVPDREKWYMETFGKCYGLFEMSKPVFVCGDPAILKEVLIRDFNYVVDRRFRGGNKLSRHFLLSLKGDEWRRVRNLITPTFTSGKMKAMMPLIKGCVDLLEQAMLKASKSSDDNADIKRLFSCYTMDVVAKCAFGVDTNAHEDGEDSFVGNARKFLTTAGRWRFVVFMLLPTRLLDAFGFTVNPPGPYLYLESAVRQIIKRRKEQGTTGTGMTRKDMLQLLIESEQNVASKDEENVADNESHHAYENDQKVDSQSAATRKMTNISEDEIVANAFLTLVAGYETTASLLTFAAYSLATNPDVQEKLRSEVRAACAENGNRLEYETVASLKYLDAVISETLRMYPPFMRADREVTSDYEIKSLGLKFKIGDVIRIPIYAMHHSADFYSDPEKYDPERFMPDNKHKLVPYTYMAFGAGPRNCIGMRFALLEAKFGLASLLLKFRFSRSSKTPEKPDFSRAQIFLTPQEIMVKIEKL